MTSRVLVAGVGNIFLGDDGFGVEVVRRLSQLQVPEGVTVRDYGIRGVHLAYELAEQNYDLVILVDAMSRGALPGTVMLFEPDLSAKVAVLDAHVLTPDAVFQQMRALGAEPERVLVVGCEPVSLEEGMELSLPVRAAVEEAVHLIQDVLVKG